MIDLHSHTTYSDGHSTVIELLKEAQSKGLSLISITDHNTVGAYTEIENSNVRNLFRGQIMNGVELTTTFNGEVIEILGYQFDLDVMRRLLDENVLTFEQKQLREFALIRDTYTAIGVKMNIDDVIFNCKKESSRIAFCNEIKKYPENNKFFLNEESISLNSGFTRNEVYNPKSPLYVNQSLLYPSLEKTIDIIHQAGGLAFLAHTFAYSPTIAENLETIIQNYRLDGLECYYTTFTKEQSKYLIGVCDRYKLFRSGGSDFHGTNKKNHNLGTGSGGMSINESLIAEWCNIKEIKRDSYGFEH